MAWPPYALQEGEYRLVIRNTRDDSGDEKDDLATLLRHIAEGSEGTMSVVVSPGTRSNHSMTTIILIIHRSTYHDHRLRSAATSAFAMAKGVLKTAGIADLEISFTKPNRPTRGHFHGSPAFPVLNKLCLPSLRRLRVPNLSSLSWNNNKGDFTGLRAIIVTQGRTSPSNNFGRDELEGVPDALATYPTVANICFGLTDHCDQQCACWVSLDLSRLTFVTGEGGSISELKRKYQEKYTVVAEKMIAHRRVVREPQLVALNLLALPDGGHPRLPPELWAMVLGHIDCLTLAQTARAAELAGKDGLASRSAEMRGLTGGQFNRALDEWLVEEGFVRGLGEMGASENEEETDCGSEVHSEDD